MKTNDVHLAGGNSERDERSRASGSQGAWLQSFTARIEKITSEKLGVSVTVARWDTLKTGAQQPIFAVPESHREQAAALGLALA